MWFEEPAHLSGRKPLTRDDIQLQDCLRLFNELMYVVRVCANDVFPILAAACLGTLVCYALLQPTQEGTLHSW
jgi:hypothetical protein